MSSDALPTLAYETSTPGPCPYARRIARGVTAAAVAAMLVCPIDVFITFCSPALRGEPLELGWIESVGMWGLVVYLSEALMLPAGVVVLAGWIFAKRIWLGFLIFGGAIAVIRHTGYAAYYAVNYGLWELSSDELGYALTACLLTGLFLTPSFRRSVNAPVR